LIDQRPAVGQAVVRAHYPVDIIMKYW